MDVWCAEDREWFLAYECIVTKEMSPCLMYWWCVGMICHLRVELDLHDLFQSNAPKWIWGRKVIHDVLHKNPKAAVTKHTKVSAVKEMPSWTEGACRTTERCQSRAASNKNPRMVCFLGCIGFSVPSPVFADVFLCIVHTIPPSRVPHSHSLGAPQEVPSPWHLCSPSAGMHSGTDSLTHFFPFRYLSASPSTITLLFTQVVRYKC